MLIFDVPYHFYVAFEAYKTLLVVSPNGGRFFYSAGAAEIRLTCNENAYTARINALVIDAILIAYDSSRPGMLVYERDWFFTLFGITCPLAEHTDVFCENLD